MEVQNCFEYLIEKTNKLSALNEAQKNIILTDLRYFLDQSKAKPEKRNHRDILSRRWKEFQMKVMRTSVLKEPKGFFQHIQNFLENSQVHPVDDKEIARFDKLEIHEFFEDMLREFENKKSFFVGDEETLTYCALKFLWCESKISSPRRDREGIRRVFQKVKPVLTKYGMFYKYNGAKGLSSRLRLFITGSL